MGRSRKPVCRQRYRGFESLPLRLLSADSFAERALPAGGMVSVWLAFPQGVPPLFFLQWQEPLGSNQMFVRDAINLAKSLEKQWGAYFAVIKTWESKPII